MVSVNQILSMTTRNLLFCLLVLGLFSCFSASKRTEFSKLKIVIDSSANFYIDTISITTNYNQYTLQYQSYDSTLETYAFTIDRLEKGKTVIQLVSFLDRVFKKEIDLAGDTTIFINANELNNFQDEDLKTMPSLRLDDGDTIVIGYSSLGCFHSLKENIIIGKFKNGYTVAFNTSRLKAYGHGNFNAKKNFDLSFSEKVNSFYIACSQFLQDRMEDAKKGLMTESTTSTFIYIRKGNSVIKLPDIGPYDWDGYDKLIAAIDPPWPKIEQ